MAKAVEIAKKVVVADMAKVGARAAVIIPNSVAGNRFTMN